MRIILSSVKRTTSSFTTCILQVNKDADQLQSKPATERVKMLGLVFTFDLDLSTAFIINIEPICAFVFLHSTCTIFILFFFFIQNFNPQAIFCSLESDLITGPKGMFSNMTI